MTDLLKIKDTETAARSTVKKLFASMIMHPHCRVSAEVKPNYHSITGKQEIFCQLHGLHGNLRSLSAVHSYKEPVSQMQNLLIELLIINTVQKHKCKDT